MDIHQYIFEIKQNNRLNFIKMFDHLVFKPSGTITYWF